MAARLPAPPIKHSSPGASIEAKMIPNAQNALSTRANIIPVSLQANYKLDEASESPVG